MLPHWQNSLISTPSNQTPCRSGKKFLTKVHSTEGNRRRLTSKSQRYEAKGLELSLGYRGEAGHEVPAKNSSTTLLAECMASFAQTACVGLSFVDDRALMQPAWRWRSFAWPRQIDRGRRTRHPKLRFDRHGPGSPAPAGFRRVPKPWLCSERLDPHRRNRASTDYGMLLHRTDLFW